MNDPNRLLGRPNGYTSKIAFADSRISKTDTDGTQKDAIERGGSIEVFPDANLAKGRAEYTQGVLKNSGLGAEHDYLQGPVLVRVTGNLSPSKAKTTSGHSADWGWRESDENSAKKSSSPGLLSTTSTVAGCSPSTMG